MTEQQQRQRDAAREADQAVTSLRTDIGFTRSSLTRAKADLSRMEGEGAKLWNETYNEALKERETSPRDV